MGHLGSKLLFEAVLADFGQPWETQLGPIWANLGTSWEEVGAKMAQDGAKMAIVAPFLEASWFIFVDLGRDLCKNGRSVKTSNTPTLLLDFGGPGSPSRPSKMFKLARESGISHQKWPDVSQHTSSAPFQYPLNTSRTRGNPFGAGPVRFQNFRPDFREFSSNIGQFGALDR